jgi:hypothetical protein
MATKNAMRHHDQAAVAGPLKIGRLFMKLLPNERTLISTNKNLLILTTHRVRIDGRSSAKSQLLSITLDSVVSCGVVTRAYPTLLLLSSLLAIVGGLNLNNGRGGEALGGPLLAVAAVCAILYFASRSALLTINAARGAIRVPVSGMGHDELVAFIDAVEEAKMSAASRA